MRLAVFGSPVAHSLSPVMHQAALGHAGIDGEYTARDVDADGLRDGLGDIRWGELTGANVTMPHKKLASALCDATSRRAERAGAVNTVVLREAHLFGDNTDIIGVRNAWEWARLPQDVPVHVLGAGAAAAAALIALEGSDVSVVARQPERAGAMVADVGVTATVQPWGAKLPPGVLVNATPLGMRGEMLPDYLLESALGLLDMTYGDEITPAVRFTQERGLPVAAGLDMLIGQAVASFEIWTGVEIDPAVMRIAAERELARRAP